MEEDSSLYTDILASESSSREKEVKKSYDLARVSARTTISWHAIGILVFGARRDYLVLTVL